MARQLREWGIDGEPAEVAVLLSSELVTNAIRHGSPPVTVLAGLSHDGVLRVEIRDDGSGETLPRHARPDDDGGRGLHLVATLAGRWGSSTTSSGKLVWFEVRAR